MPLEPKLAISNSKPLLLMGLYTKTSGYTETDKKLETPDLNG